MNVRYAVITIATLALLSFLSPAGKIEFNYPTDKKAVITMTTDRFKKMEKEAQGTDYYYHGESDNGIICSVLFYKLNADEVTQLVDAPAKILGFPENSPAYPQTYFATYSQTKDLESNEQRWGDPSADFMFRQADIKEFQGQVVNQKNMYGYAMFGKDLFVNIHLSKGNCSAADSIEMRQILESLKKGK